MNATRTMLGMSLGALLCTGAGAQETTPRTARQLTDCMRAALPARSSVQTMVMRSKDRIGATTESRLKVYWQQQEDGTSRVLLRFTAPPDMRGSAILLLEQDDRSDDMFMYLPEIKRSRRITGHMSTGSMFGSDFTYEQFQRMQGMADDADVKLLEDGELEGRRVRVLEHRPKPASESQFERILSYVDPANCVPLKIEYYEPGERLRKVLTADPSQVEQVENSWIARKLLMRDLRDGTETEVEVEEIDVNARIKRKIFTERELARGH